MAGMRLEVKGVRELRRDLRGLGSDLDRESEQADREAAQMVASRARSAARGIGGVATKAAPSIRSEVSGGASTVTLGGPRYPFAAGAEFGARHNVPRARRSGRYLGLNQFRPYDSAGYFLYPSVDRTEDAVTAIYGDAADRALERAFPD